MSEKFRRVATMKFQMPNDFTIIVKASDKVLDFSTPKLRFVRIRRRKRDKSLLESGVALRRHARKVKAM